MNERLRQDYLQAMNVDCYVPRLLLPGALPSSLIEGLGVESIISPTELSEEDKLSVARARKIERFLSQPFDVAKVFTGSDGVQVPLEDTIASFKAVVAGEYDHLPEGAFYMVGGIDDVKAKAERMAADAA